MRKEAGKILYSRILYNNIEIIPTKINSDYYRLIPTISPRINLYERIIPEDKLEFLHKVEMMTNPRVREAMGETDVIKEQDTYKGGNRHLIEAPFLYKNPTRFSDGSFGVFYAAKEKDTAIEETKYHKAMFYASTSESPFLFQMSVLTGEIEAEMHDIRNLSDKLELIYSPSSYSESQNFGEILKSNDSDGVVYDSVRHAKGICFGVFKPNKVKSIKEMGIIPYYWNGKKIVVGHLE